MNEDGTSEANNAKRYLRQERKQKARVAARTIEKGALGGRESGVNAVQKDITGSVSAAATDRSIRAGARGQGPRHCGTLFSSVIQSAFAPEHPAASVQAIWLSRHCVHLGKGGAKMRSQSGQREQ